MIDLNWDNLKNQNLNESRLVVFSPLMKITYLFFLPGDFFRHRTALVQTVQGKGGGYGHFSFPRA